MAVGG